MTGKSHTVVRATLGASKSEAFTEAVLRASPDAIVAMDHEGKVVAFNAAAERIFGYSSAEAIGAELADLIIPARLRAAHHRGLSHYLASGDGPVLHRTIELPALRADGTEFPTEITIVPIGDAHAPMFTAFVRDITERKQGQQALEASEAHARSIFESSPDCVKIIDLQGRIEQMNTNGQCAMEIDDFCAVNGVYWSDLWPQEARADVEAAIAEARAGRTGHFSGSCPTAKGTPKWWDVMVTAVAGAGGVPVRLVVASRDITERVQAEEAMNERKARQAFIVSLGDLLRELDDPRAVMAAAAEALGRRLGVSRVGYGEIDVDGKHIRYETCWTDGAVAPIIGVYPLGVFGAALMAELARGVTATYEDTQADPRIARLGFAAVQAHAAMAVPLVRDGKLRATLYLSDGAPRRWPAHDVTLVEDVAARIWAAVERARAEEALAQQNRRLNLLTKIIGDLQLQGDAHGLLQQAFDTVAAEIDADIYFNYLPVEDAGERLRLASSGGIDAATRAAFAEIAVGQYLCGRVAQNRIPLVLSKLQDDPTEATSGVRRLGVRCYAGFPLIAQGQLLGTVAFCATTKDAFAPLDVELIETVSSQFAAAIARDRLNAELRDSEDRFRAIAENIPQLAWMADGEGNVDWFNKGWLDYTGTRLEDNLGAGWKAVHHPDHVEAVAEKFERHLREKRDDWEDTFPLRGADGEYRWFLSRMNAIRDGSGKVVRFFGTNTDITASRQAEERQSFLSEELAHRGKNLLAVVQAIVSRSLSGKRSIAEARGVIESRIQALARSQSILVSGAHEGVSLAELIRGEFEAFSGRVDANGPDIMLNARAAQTIALLVHELATNATKHGALSLPGGRVAIAWAVEGTGAAARFRFQWQERGGPPVAEPTRRGFGSVLIEKAVAQDFGAEPVIGFAPDGLRYGFDAPLSAIAAVRLPRS